MKLFLKRMIAVFLSVICVVGFMPMNTVKADSVALNEVEKTLYTGQTFTLKLENASGDITWKSSDSKIAKVDKGLVTAVKSGTATISATYSGKTYKCYVIVKAARINCKQATLYEDGSITLKVYGKKVSKFKTSDKRVAKVSKKGVVTAVSEGKATITVTCTDKTVYYCDVTVKSAYDGIVPLSELDVFANSGTIAFNSGLNSDIDYSKDNLGNIHRDYLTTLTDHFPFVSYKVNREYSFISGVLYTPYAFRNDEYGIEIIIYGDGEVLWRGKTALGSDPKEFKLDISQVNEIKIEWNHNKLSYGQAMRVVIGDLHLVP